MVGTSTVSQWVTDGGWNTQSLREQHSWKWSTASLQLHPDESDAEGLAEKPQQSEETVRKE